MRAMGFYGGLLAGVAALTLTTSCSWKTATAKNDLGQGWAQADRDYWYEQTQGSRLIPYAWAKALETADGSGIFFSTANITHHPPRSKIDKPQ